MFNIILKKSEGEIDSLAFPFEGFVSSSELESISRSVLTSMPVRGVPITYFQMHNQNRLCSEDKQYQELLRNFIKDDLSLYFGEKINEVFEKDPFLFMTAFTTPDYASSRNIESNKSLEFAGDKFLSHAITAIINKKVKYYNNDCKLGCVCYRIKTNIPIIVPQIINNDNLDRIGREFGLDKILRTSPNTNVSLKDIPEHSPIACCVEAFISAINIILGEINKEEVFDFMSRLFERDLSVKNLLFHCQKDQKTTLKEFFDKELKDKSYRNMINPGYKSKRVTSGFSAAAYVILRRKNKNSTFKIKIGEGCSYYKNISEFLSAKEALENIQNTKYAIDLAKKIIDSEFLSIPQKCLLDMIEQYFENLKKEKRINYQLFFQTVENPSMDNDKKYMSKAFLKSGNMHDIGTLIYLDYGKDKEDSLNNIYIRMIEDNYEQFNSFLKS